MAPTLHLLLSVDTEEDQWLPRSREVTHENARELLSFQAFAERLGLRPTYFATHSFAADLEAGSILADLARRGAEIGAHVHPWTTPPFEEEFGGRNTMLCNLPAQLQRKKIAATRDALTMRLERPPTSFRAGRFGLGRETAEALLEAGFEVDSSVTPFIDWSGYDEGPDFDGAPLDPYRIDPRAGLLRPAPDGRLREVPVSCGYTHARFETLARVHRRLERSHGRSLALGALSRLGLVRRVLGSPEGEATADLVALARRVLERGHRHVHLFLHSSSLLPGLTPFAPDLRSRDRLLARLADFVEAVHGFASVETATIGEYARRALS